MALPRARLRLWSCALASLATALGITLTADSLGELGDCTMARPDERRWIVSNNHLAYELGMGEDGVLRANRLELGETKIDLVAGAPSDTGLVVDGEELVLGQAAPLSFRGDRAEAYGTGLRLVLSYESDRVSIEKSIACYPDVALLEQWLTVSSRDPEAALTVERPDLLSWSTAGTQLEWLRGLNQPDDIGSFTIERRELLPGDHVELRAFARSTESVFPWAVIRTERASLIAGVLWSGAWAMDVDGTETGSSVRVGLPSFATRVTAVRSFESPHVFFGGAGPTTSDVGRTMRRYVDVAIRAGRPLWPLATYNTWFSHGIQLNESVVAREILRASELGLELFELDAGWYPHPGDTPVFDFTAGLGRYQADGERFPRGLRALGVRAREHGLKFGVWVEPERVDVSLVGRPGGPAESWLARNGGRAQPTSGNADPRGAMMCLAHPEARAWVFNQVAALIEREGIDYLKWDNNAWLNCDRDGHGHGPLDGNFAQVRGLYDVLRELRQRFPSLLIENVSGGGHRIDLEMLRYTDVGWMDDRTTPSTHVRHNLQGLSRPLPLAYLLSYVMAHESEPLHEADDPRWLVRSRMPGVLGFSYRADDLTHADSATLSGEIAIYKRLRDILADAHAILLTPQASSHGADDWDIVEALSPGTGRAVLFAFGPVNLAPTRAKLQGLDPDASYLVESVDRGVLGTYPGVLLREVGLDLGGTRSSSRAQTFVISPVP